MNAVIYARYSSSNQREESIEGQIRECKSYAKKNKLAIVKSYIDRALSATTDHRPEFQKMVLDSAKMTFQVVLVYQLDRFARNRYDSAIYKAKLKKNGVRVISAKEHITNDPSGIILESVLEGMAEYYSVELSQKVLRGMTENALSCRWASGTIPFGYKVDKEKHLLIDTEKAEIAKKIFLMYASGKQYVDISTYVNNLGVRTKRGNKFSRSSYHRMLANEVYIGTFKWKDIRKEHAVPAIVDEKVFYAVQERLKIMQRGNTTPIESSQFLLTGKLVCKECGSHFAGSSGTSKNGKAHYYYRCNGNKAGKCNMRLLPAEKLENSIIDESVNLLSQKSFIADIASNACLLHNKEIKENEELNILSSELKSSRLKLKNCLQAVENGMVSTSLQERINALEKEVKDLEQNYHAASVVANPVNMTPEMIEFFLEQILKTKNKDERKRNIIFSLIKDIEIQYKEKDIYLLINYNLLDRQTSKDRPEAVSKGVRLKTTWWR